MAELLAKPAEYQNLFDLPENQVGEILMGTLHATPRPTPKHANASSSLTMEVGGPYHKGRGGPGGWWILDEPELHLGDNIMVPDLAGWRRERMRQLPEQAWFDLVPDWVCEVLSPSTQRTGRVIKMPLYASCCVQWLWLIDPDIRTLEAYQLADGHWVLQQTFADDAQIQLPPFDAVGFCLGSLWG